MLNAKSASARIAAEAQAAGYDFQSAAGRRGLIARAHAEQHAVDRAAGKFQPAYSYCPDGLMALSNKGIAVFEEAHPNVLPWNLYKNGPAGQGWYSYNLECTREEQERLVSAHARFSGWMRAAASLPLLTKAIAQSVSPRGEGSRRTFVSLWGLAAKYPSPHRLQRRIGAVQRRAVEILRAYDGRGCTLRSVLIALEATGSVGKAAVVAAYRSLTGEVPRREHDAYRQARNALVALHACRVQDNTDGVAVSRTAEPVYNKLGVRVYPYAQKSSSGWGQGRLVLCGGRSYHESAGRWGIGTVEHTVKKALEAWQKQKKLEREEKSFLDQLRPDGFCPIVYFQDSRSAGNCAEGTRSFMDRAGIPASRRFVPAQTLFPYLGEQRVRNTLALVARAVSALRAA